jgi:hypothetical protein
MRLRTLITMAAAGTGSWAAQTGSTEARSVPVCVSGDPKVPLGISSSALAYATPYEGTHRAASENR